MAPEGKIHPTAIVEEGARIGAGVSIGPFSVIGADVVLGDGVEIASHVSITGATTLGAGCRIASHAALGGAPQNVKHRGGRTTLVIGENTVIREFVTMNTGSDNSRGTTQIGPNGFFLAYAHVGHDCVVGRNAVFANGATLGGHCDIGDNVGMGGLSAVHQFVRIGDGAFVSGCAAVSGDVMPFGFAQGVPAKLRGLNMVGLRRSGMSADELKQIKALYLAIFDRSGTMLENLEKARASFGATPAEQKILDFFSARGKRHYVVPRVRGRLDDAEDDAA